MRPYAVRSLLRRAAAAVLSRLPRFRGKGRITLLIDRLVTNSRDPRSYIAVGRVNGGGVMAPVVPIRRLDDVVDELGIDDITLIKIDVEGFEPEVLKGGRETIRRMLPVIFAEFNRERMRINGFTMDESWDFLTSCGYHAYRLVADRFEAVTAPGELEDLYFLPSELTPACAAAATAPARRSTPS